jgi:hypothetical protein
MVIPLNQKLKNIRNIVEAKFDYTISDRHKRLFLFSSDIKLLSAIEYENIIFDFKNNSISIEKMTNIYCSDDELSNNIRNALSQMIRIVKKLTGSTIHPTSPIVCNNILMKVA